MHFGNMHFIVQNTVWNFYLHLTRIVISNVFYYGKDYTNFCSLLVNASPSFLRLLHLTHNSLPVIISFIHESRCRQQKTDMDKKEYLECHLFLLFKPNAFYKTCIREIRVRKAYRMGVTYCNKDGEQRPRPLKVILESAEQAQKLIDTKRIFSKGFPPHGKTEDERPARIKHLLTY